MAQERAHNGERQLIRWPCGLSTTPNSVAILAPGISAEGRGLSRSEISVTRPLKNVVVKPGHLVVDSDRGTPAATLVAATQTQVPAHVEGVHHGGFVWGCAPVVWPLHPRPDRHPLAQRHGGLQDVGLRPFHPARPRQLLVG